MKQSMVKPISELGYHYYTDDRHFTENDLSIWLPRLHALGANWITLRSTPRRAIPEQFIKGLLAEGIEPIIHLPCLMEGVTAESLLPLFSSYERWGVRYVVVFDRPNLRRNWGEAAWSRKNLVERFIDLILPVLQAEQSSGLFPVLPALEPGGDSWDTAFLEGALTSLARRGMKNLMDGLTLSLYAWTYDHPIDWGYGGPERWIETRPYHTQPGSQDQFGFRIFDWYSAIAQKALGRSLPMLVLAGGAAPSSCTGGMDPEEHAEKNISILRTIESGDIPPSLKVFSFFLLAAESSNPNVNDAWYSVDRDALPVVQGFQRLISSSTKGIRKSLAHYVLIPEKLDVSEVMSWRNVSDLIKDVKPTFGFSPMEARLAQSVTIVGDEDLVPLSIEKDLREVGCTVQRVTKEELSEVSDVQSYLDYFLSNIVGEKHV
jgi:hypothetical protein